MHLVQSLGQSEFVDIDLDGTKELIVVGEWMPDMNYCRCCFFWGVNKIKSLCVKPNEICTLIKNEAYSKELTQDSCS